ncbi:MAG: hypothetical protein KGH59_02855 [Candidatus Micrarchaeota archaeon]|nr:hypothetical protein [Candidatus Micrarchaeota archaeon]MDE1804696.1 hypothetical protein [Candidatus Micrarchaeota archaeon]MDE1846804.1 hypothetical protein [Candidatus Micrarchaeota archaeon]
MANELVMGAGAGKSDKDYLPEVFFANRLLHSVLRKEGALNSDEIKVLHRAREKVESMIEGMNVVSGSSRAFTGIEPITSYRLALESLAGSFDVKSRNDISIVLNSVRDEIAAAIIKGKAETGSLKVTLPFFSGYKEVVTRYQQQQAMENQGF